MNNSVLSMWKRNFRLAFAVCGAALMWAGAPIARADDFNLIEQRGQASLGTFINSSAMTIRVDGAAGQAGTTIDWDREFGKGEATRFRLDGVWRFNDRHHLRLMYTDYSNTRTRAIDQDVEWEGDLIPVNATVDSKLGFNIIEAAYEYAFKHSDKFELTATLGLHYTTFDATLTADVPAQGGGIVTVGGPASVDAPLPVFGAHGMWRMGQNFYFDSQAQYFALSIDSIKGNLLNYRAAVIWQPKRSVGVGAGYDYFNVNVDLAKKKFIGSLDWTYSGPQVFFNLAF